MNIYKYPGKTEWNTILKRPVFELGNLYESVQKIIDEVKEKGDSAAIKYTKQFDNVDIEILAVGAKEFSDSESQISEKLKSGIEQARNNIEKFHKGQIVADISVETSQGVLCMQKSVPIQKVGLYIPGGSAPLLSTALMLGIPARLAGCKEIVLCSPPGENGKINPAIIYVANLLGIEKVFKVGGAQAIAAMAYGTESIPKVDKIFGPGNQYLTAAKQLVSRDSVAIDMPAGPSELAVMADKSGIPAFIASDLLSQAEHGPDSQVILITDTESMIEGVQSEIEKQLKQLPRKDIAAKALLNSKLILLKDKNEMIEMINEYAPEHLIIACESYREIAHEIVNAGSIFLGNYTPESAGDYASGTNHTLPTNGWARAYSGLNMDAFFKKITLQEISESGLLNISNAIINMANAEELQAHSNAVSIRLPKED